MNGEIRDLQILDGIQNWRGALQINFKMESMRIMIQLLKSI